MEEKEEIIGKVRRKMEQLRKAGIGGDVITQIEIVCLLREHFRLKESKGGDAIEQNSTAGD